MPNTSEKRSWPEAGGSIPARGGTSRIRRFNGLSKRTSDWDGLRRDSQLWDDSADCVVHFSAFRASQRGPSLKIPFDAVKALNCEYLMDQCLRTHNKLSPIPSEDGHSDSGYGSELERTEHELYISAPSDRSKDQAFEYHLTTRNLFAFAVGKPLVGERLSDALFGVWQRLEEWQISDRPLEKFTDYCKTQGYLKLAENAEHALAFLKFAEDARLRHLWIDAFVHCVGMHQRLDLSPEWRGLSKTTVALITRASLEMDLHIARIIRALGGFLEEELGSEHLGLSRHARDHLDRFRSFLHAFYVDKLGYFPPKPKKSWDKTVWARIHRDFQSLYDYLVDKESTFDLNGSRGMTGGVCVVQNLSAFDERHGYNPLPHPLPLLPAEAPKLKRGVSSQRGLRNLTLGMNASTSELRPTPRQSMEKASNAQVADIMSCTLVREYQRFEQQRAEEKLDHGEARKIRWILIYGVLQMLNSIMSAPKEVTDTKKVSYPLCSLTTGCPPWKDSAPTSPMESEPVPQASETGSTSLAPDATDARDGRSSRISIHPDCEAENAEQFFATGGISRQPSQIEVNAAPSPLRVNTQLGRRNSIRESMHSSVNMLQKSLGSLNRRGSSRRNSLASATEPKKMSSFCHIVVEGYGNGMERERTLTDSPVAYEDDHTIPIPSAQPSSDFALFDFGLANDEPTLDSHDLVEPDFAEHLHAEHPELVGASPRDSHASEEYVVQGVSSNCSIADPGTPPTEVDSGDEEDFDDDSKSSRGGSMRMEIHSYQPSKPATNSSTSVSAGCYLPTGMITAPRSRFAHSRQAASQSSVLTTASSVYVEEATQAAEIGEEEARGRRRSRMLDNFARVDGVARSGVAL